MGEKAALHLPVCYELLSWELGGREGFLLPQSCVLCESVGCLLLRLSIYFLKPEVHLKSSSFASSFGNEDMERGLPEQRSYFKACQEPRWMLHR